MLDRGEAECGSHGRVTAVGTDGEVGFDPQVAVGGRRFDTDDPAVLDDCAGHVRPHEQPECGMPSRGVGEHVEQVPLRHQGDEAVGRGQ